MKRIISLFLILALLLIPQTAIAGDTLTWGNHYSRDRVTNDNVTDLYDSSPIKFSIGDILGTWGLSYATPVVYNNILYQLVWHEDAPGVNAAGYLIAIDVSNPAPQSASDFKVKYVATFPLEDGEDPYGIAAPSISPDGKYMSMGFGKYLYTWPLANGPDSSGVGMTGMRRYIIQGNDGQGTSEIAMSPSISSINYDYWQGVNQDSFETVTFSAPPTVVGSWNGGFTIAPLFAPEHVIPSNVVNYHTTKTDTSWAGAIFTSSPAIQANGNILMGVDYPNGGYPMIFRINPSDLSVDHFGDGFIRYGIASSPAVDINTENVYVPDKFGNLYEFDPNGNPIGRNMDDSGQLDISNIAIGGDYIYAVRAGKTKFQRFDKGLNGGETIISDSNNYRSPTVIHDGQGEKVVINDPSSLIIIDTSAGFQETPLDVQIPDYSTALPAVGPAKMIVAWTNDKMGNLNREGGLLFYTAAKPSLKLTVDKNPTEPMNTTTLTATPVGLNIMAGETANIILTIDGTQYPMTRHDDSKGAYFTFPYVPPDVKVDTVVNAQAKLDYKGQTYLSNIVPITIQSGGVKDPCPIDGNTPGVDLSLTVYRTQDKTDPGTRSATEARFGDKITAILNISDPPIPDGGWVTGRTLSATIGYPVRTPGASQSGERYTIDKGVTDNNREQSSMNITGSGTQATYDIVVSWPDWDPRIIRQMNWESPLGATWDQTIYWEYLVPTPLGAVIVSGPPIHRTGCAQTLPLNIIGTEYYLLPSSISLNN